MGVFVLIVLGIGYFIHSCKNDIANNNKRERGRINNDKYYTDQKGKLRLVENNHEILWTVDNVNGNIDRVLLDMTSNQVLRNKSEEERQEKRDRNERRKQETIESREIAKKEGRYFYTTALEPPVCSGLFEDFYASLYKKNPARAEYNWYAWHTRRVSDDLLLAKDTCTYHPIKEAKYGLIVYDIEAEKKKNKEKLTCHAEWNWKLINDWKVGKVPIGWKENDYRPSGAEVEVYAREVGAYLDISASYSEKSRDPQNYEEQVKIIYDYYLKHKQSMVGLFHLHTDKIFEELDKHGYRVPKDIILKMLHEIKRKLEEGNI